MATLETLEAKLDELIETLKAAGTVKPKPAYELPAIGADEAVVDEKTINRDGSIWAHDWRTGQPQAIAYGYFSREKDPETYDKLAAKLGDAFENWYQSRDKWAIYAGSPKAYADAGDINWVTLMTFVLKPRTRFVQ